MIFITATFRMRPEDADIVGVPVAQDDSSELGEPADGRSR
jgi:hypothetical protein